MGRDDRLVSDRGREARFPFLDEGVAARLLATPLCDVADLSESQELGDKLLIRAAARRLGMHRAAARAKRAIQFGSRVSKRFDSRSDARVAARGARRGRVGFVDRVRRVDA
jgi:asparagine synthetase B (glutamine-hydrolysing)